MIIADIVIITDGTVDAVMITMQDDAGIANNSCI